MGTCNAVVSGLIDAAVSALAGKPAESTYYLPAALTSNQSNQIVCYAEASPGNDQPGLLFHAAPRAEFGAFGYFQGTLTAYYSDRRWSLPAPPNTLGNSTFPFDHTKTENVVVTVGITSTVLEPGHPEAGDQAYIELTFGATPAFTITPDCAADIPSLDVPRVLVGEGPRVGTDASVKDAVWALSLGAGQVDIPDIPK